MTTAIVSRPFGRLGDFDKVLTFVQQVAQGANRPELSMHVGDVTWRFFRSTRFDPSANIQLWEHASSQNIAGMGWYTAAHYGVDLLVANDQRNSGLEKRILAWANQKLRQIPFEKRGHAQNKIQVFEWDTQREQVLNGAGFRRDMFHYLWFRHDLTADIEPPTLPAGFTIRPMTAQDAAERAALNNAAFFIDGISERSYLNLMGAEQYRPELDLVAIAPDGRLAAFALGWLDPVLKTGLFEPVGTHLDFRRLGLAKALVFEGMRRMQAADMRMAQVYTESPNLHAQKLYRSIGFKTVGKQFDWVVS